MVLLVVGCLGVVCGRFEHFLKDRGIPEVLRGMHASAVIGTTLRLVSISPWSGTEAKHCSHLQNLVTICLQIALFTESQDFVL